MPSGAPKPVPMLTWAAALILRAAGLAALPPRPIYAYRPPAPLVALTFDDGPDPRWTPKLLALLTQHRAAATFFVLGQAAEGHPELVEAEARQGSEVANHGYRHARMTALSPAAELEEIRRTADVVAGLTGRAPRFFRPPFGVFSDRTVRAAWQRGEKTVLWSVDTRDWQGRSANAMVNEVLGAIQPGDVVLFHDGGGDRRNTVAAVAILLRELERMGYRAVTLSDLERAGGGEPWHAYPPRGAQHHPPSP